MTRCPSLVVTAIGGAAEGAGAEVIGEGGGAAAAGSACSSAGCPQPAISSAAASAKDFHISLRFLFMVEVFDDGGSRPRTKRAQGLVIHRRGGHDRAATIVGIARIEPDRVLAIDEEVGHPAGVGSQQRNAEGRGFEDDVRQTVIKRRNDDEIAGGVERQEVEAVAKGQGLDPQRRVDVADQQQMKSIGEARLLQQIEKELRALLLLELSEHPQHPPPRYAIALRFGEIMWKELPGADVDAVGNPYRFDPRLE